MILKVLSDHYDELVAKGLVPPRYWSETGVSYVLKLSENGNLVAIVSIKDKIKVKKKDKTEEKEVPARVIMPEPIKKTSVIASNFLCENGAYFLGYDIKENPERAKRCFEEARRLHHEILDPVDNQAAKEILLFFDKWNPDEAKNSTILAPYLNDLKKGATLIFKNSDESYPHDNEMIRAAWETHCANKVPETLKMIDLVTGTLSDPVRLHGSISGIRGGLSTGMSLVSYNDTAFESYGHEKRYGTGQGMNAPVSELTAFKYTTALNYMLSDFKHTLKIGDTTILYWAETADPVCQEMFEFGLFGTGNEYTLDDIKSVVDQMKIGGNVNIKEDEVNPDNKFYILGITPNSARISIRMFEQDSFGSMLTHLLNHQERLKIVRPSFADDNEMLTLPKILMETINKKNLLKAKPNDPYKDLPASFVEPLLRSILYGTQIPDALYTNIIVRIRTERSMNWKKAAIIKAYFLSLPDNDQTKKYKEAATMELNENSEYTPYVLGRIFATFEKIQKDANPNVNTTIKDSFFSSAPAKPSVVLPKLIKLSAKHLRKLDDKKKIYYDRLLQELNGKIHTTYPDSMDIKEQGAFYQGYYFQETKFYEKKKPEEKQSTETEVSNNAD